ncbi:hypothetical protein MesoLjLa_39710 [Mesorhizobium sp. L-2-11]|nr:hypothetical protein MesoLjLa_39710 [Mesorhizobium sp. L-2-11]
MGEIIRVNLRVDPNAIANERSAALVKQDRVLSGLRCGDEAGCPGREARALLASGLMARFDAFRLPPEIEAENIHSN